MKRMLKILLLWLLALALPMQGMAATSYACDMQHTHAHVGTAGHQHDAADAVHAGHGAHQQLQMVDKDMSDSCTKSSQSTPSHKHLTPSQCSTCAACCVGNAIPATQLDLRASATPSFAVLPSPESLIAGHIPDPLKRPPRSASV